MQDRTLVGIGLYSLAEASRYLRMPVSTIRRWLLGHEVSDRTYDPLWTPQVRLEDGSVYLGFRDLMEVRTANLFRGAGLSAQAIRRAIVSAREVVGDDRPLSTRRLKTDGRTIFLRLAEEQDGEAFLDLLDKQYVFRRIVEQSLRDVDFDGIVPSRWRVSESRGGAVVLDPQRNFGQPIDEATGVPTAILAKAAEAIGDPRVVARDWDVTPQTVRRAVAFEGSLDRQAA